MGASVIPFCVHQGKVHFLFHKTFSGRRAGCLVDFGGGGEKGESWQQTAIREFIEETETMFFSNDVANAVLNEKSLQYQTPILESIFAKTIERYPDWWCARENDNKNGEKRDWRTFFIEFDFKDPLPMNREWESDRGQRFKKRRELIWVPYDQLLEIYKNNPERLWKRLRQLKGVEEVVSMINLGMIPQKPITQEQ